MQEKFIYYKSFFEEETFIEFKQFLKKNKIEFESKVENPNIYHTSANVITPEYIVKIKQSDYDYVEGLVSEIMKNEVENVNSDHYLFSFSDSELYEIITKPEEWSSFDFQLAKKILKDRGKEIDETLISKIKEVRNENLAEPEEYPKSMVLVGYFSSFLGGFLGLIIGYILLFSKKTLPNGEEFYTYPPKARNHGLGILVLSALVLGVIWYFKFRDI